MKILTFNLLTVLQVFLSSSLFYLLIWFIIQILYIRKVLIFMKTKSVHLFFPFLTFKSQYTPEMW